VRLTQKPILRRLLGNSAPICDADALDGKTIRLLIAGGAPDTLISRARAKIVGPAAVCQIDRHNTPPVTASSEHRLRAWAH